MHACIHTYIHTYTLNIRPRLFYASSVASTVGYHMMYSHCIYVYMYMFIHIYIERDIYMYIYIYILTYIYIYIYTYICYHAMYDDMP